MRVVILGYSGLIGHSILKYLLKNTSFNLICVGRNIEKISSYNSRIEYFKWNFSSFTKRNLIFLENADILINCVGKTDENNKDLEYLNFIFLKKIINYIRNQKINLRFIHLSSVAVYGGMKAYFGQFKIITEKTKTIENNLYSLNKLKSDLFIQNLNKKKFNKNFTFTILRISNVFGGEKKSNLFKYVFLSLKIGIWIKSFQKVQFNFVNVNDVAQAVFLVISKLKVSKNKVYIVSDDCEQQDLYKRYKLKYKKRFLQIHIPIMLIKFLVNFIPLPKKILNLIFIISSRVLYDNQKIIKELKFKPRYSIQKIITLLNEKKT